MEVAKNEVRNVAKISGKFRHCKNNRTTIGNSWEKLGNNLENNRKTNGKNIGQIRKHRRLFLSTKIFLFFGGQSVFFSYCLLFCKFPGCACNSSIIIRELPETQRASLMQNCFSYCSWSSQSLSEDHATFCGIEQPQLICHHDLSRPHNICM